MFKWLKKWWQGNQGVLEGDPTFKLPHPRQHIIDQIEEVDSEDPRLWEYFTEEETDDTDA